MAGSNNNNNNRNATIITSTSSSSSSSSSFLRKQPRYLPQSLPLLLARRVEGRLPTPGGRSFLVGVAKQFVPQTLVQNPRLVTTSTDTTTSTTAAATTTNKASTINALHVDRNENRFVLTGGADAIISIYDISKWGSEEYYHNTKRNVITTNNNSTRTSRATNSANNNSNNNNKRSIHKPIASSQRQPPRRSIFTDEETIAVEIPTGHTSSVTKVQWYPVDTGVFVSSSKDGSLLVWDTESMIPVAHCTPFTNLVDNNNNNNTILQRGGGLLGNYSHNNNANNNNNTSSIGNFHISPKRYYSAVVSSTQNPVLKLVDIRTSASSHTLIGHSNTSGGGGGVSSVQWAPHNDVIIASGGYDGTIRLWDIRKAGGRACLTILNQENTYTTTTTSSSTNNNNKAYKADYSHLPKPPLRRRKTTTTIPSTYEENSAGIGRRTTGTTTTTTTMSRQRDAHYSRHHHNNNHHHRAAKPPATAAAAASIDLAPNNYRRMENTTIVSHDGPVTAISFGARGDGHYIVSAGRQDGMIKVWDLRGSNKKQLLPIRFMAADGQQPAILNNHQRQTSSYCTPMLLTNFGITTSNSSRTSCDYDMLGSVWVGHGSTLLGYSLERGGLPKKVLQGHLNTITAIDTIEATMQILTAGKDGLILTWGKKTPPSSSDHGGGAGGNHPQQRKKRKKVDRDCW